MSAPSLAIPAAPSLGHSAAPKRGAATSDADFAAILDETAPSEAPAKTAAPAKRETEAPADAAQLPKEEAAADAVPVGEAPLAASAPLNVPTPPVVAASTVAGEAAPAVSVPPIAPPASDAVEGAASEASRLVPAGEASPASFDDLVTAPSLPDGEPDAAPAPGSASVDLPNLAALQTERAKAAAPAPAAAAAASQTPVAPAVTPPAARPSKPITDASASDQAAPAEDARFAAPATAPLEARVAPVDTPRTRDVIDRAQGVRIETQGTGVSDHEASAAASDAPEAAAPNAAAPPAASARPAPNTVPAAAPIPVSAEGADAAPLGTTPQSTDARPVETPVSLALSTLSRATIETTAQIAAQIVRKLEGRSTRFEMALTPEGLGNVDVSLDIDADGKLIARMAFDNPLAATELRGRADELRRQLQEAGFIVADDALSFAERDASAGQQGGSAFDRRPDPRNTRAFGAASRLEADADRLLTPTRWIPLTLTPDRVDMKV